MRVREPKYDGSTSIKICFTKEEWEHIRKESDRINMDQTYFCKFQIINNTAGVLFLNMAYRIVQLKEGERFTVNDLLKPLSKKLKRSDMIASGKILQHFANILMITKVGYDGIRSLYVKGNDVPSIERKMTRQRGRPVIIDRKTLKEEQERKRARVAFLKDVHQKYMSKISASIGDDDDED